MPKGWNVSIPAVLGAWSGGNRQNLGRTVIPKSLVVVVQGELSVPRTLQRGILVSRKL